MPLMALLMLMAFFVSSGQAAVLMTKNWEDNDIDSGLSPVSEATCFTSGPCPWAATVSSSIVASGSFAARFELNGDDPGTVFGSATQRSELRAYGIHAKFGVERWYGFAVRIDSIYSDSTSDPNGTIITQWHGAAEDPGDGTHNPSLNINVRPNDHFFATTCHDSSVPTLEGCPNRVDRDLGLLTRNVWHRFVVHAKWALDSTGILQIWKDGTLVVNETGANAFNDGACCPFGLFFGIYKSWWNVVGRPAGDTLITYYDELRIGDQNSNFNEVNPPGASDTTPPAAPTNLRVVSP